MIKLKSKKDLIITIETMEDGSENIYTKSTDKDWNYLQLIGILESIKNDILVKNKKIN